MSDEEQQDVLQAYCERTREDAPGAGDGGSEDGGSESSSSEEEGYSTKHDQVRCSAGSACTDPTSTTFSGLCKHRSPRHFDCAELPCEEGCGDRESSEARGGHGHEEGKG